MLKSQNYKIFITQVFLTNLLTDLRADWLTN
jgi:hypothetical protein